MQTLSSKVTCARLSIQTFSPIQQWLPMVSFQGYFMFTLGLMTTPLPILAPKAFNQNIFSAEEGFHAFFRKMRLMKYHTNRFGTEPGLYQELLKEDKFVFIFFLTVDCWRLTVGCWLLTSRFAPLLGTNTDAISQFRFDFAPIPDVIRSVSLRLTDWLPVYKNSISSFL